MRLGERGLVSHGLGKGLCYPLGPELDGVPPAVPPDPEALSRRTTELVADLVEPAKADALEKAGEGRQALAIASAWVRGKLAPKAAGGDPVADQELIDAASSKWLT